MRYNQDQFYSSAFLCRIVLSTTFFYRIFCIRFFHSHKLHHRGIQRLSKKNAVTGNLRKTTGNNTTLSRSCNRTSAEMARYDSICIQLLKSIKLIKNLHKFMQLDFWAAFYNFAIIVLCG